MSQNNSHILLSIVVPTKNRYYYLKHMIELVEMLHSNQVELVIQDNTADNSDIVDYIKEKHYSFINYNHITESISMTENSDAAILNSKGEYICFLGDDDGFSSLIVGAAEYMKENGIDAMLGRQTVYNWPDFVDGSLFHMSSTFTTGQYSKQYKRINSLSEFRRSEEAGFDHLHLMPRSYQALVSRNIMNRIYEKCHTFFPGPSPDMANAVALSLLNPVCYYWDAPIVISGQSKNVGGGERLSAELKHISQVVYLPKNVESIWDKRIPPYWCSDFIWPVSAITACNAMQHPCILKQDKVMARFLLSHLGHKKLATDYSNSRLLMCFYFVKYFFVKVFKYLLNRIVYIFTGKKYLLAGRLHRGAASINEVYTLLFA